MTILCTIDLETREVSIPSGQCIAAYDHNVDVIRFQAEAIPGFSLNTSSIKIAAQGPNKSRHDYAVDPSTVTIEEETGYITFDWPIPAGVTEMPIGTFKYGDKGNLIFAVCAEIISGSTVSKAWHSDDGIITVVAHLEPESGGGEDPEEEATNAQKIGQLQTDVAAINTQVGALANGSPTPVSTVAEMTDESAVYLYTGSETGYTAGNWYYYDGSAWTSGGTYGGAVTDTTLSVGGSAADAKAVGDALTDKADADDVVNIQTALAGKANSTDVESLAEDIAELQDGGYVADQQKISEKINDWLDEHPEATTTVQDYSLTAEKFIKGQIGFITPQMFGAVADGSTDDAEAIQAAINYAMVNNVAVYFPSGTYAINPQPIAINFVGGDSLVMYGDGKTSCIKRKDDSLANKWDRLFLVNNSYATADSGVLYVHDLFIDSNRRNQSNATSGYQYESAADFMTYCNNANGYSLDTAIFENLWFYDGVADHLDFTGTGVVHIKNIVINNVFTSGRQGTRNDIDFPGIPECNVFISNVVCQRMHCEYNGTPTSPVYYFMNNIKCEEFTFPARLGVFKVENLHVSKYMIFGCSGGLAVFTNCVFHTDTNYGYSYLISSTGLSKITFENCGFYSHDVEPGGDFDSTYLYLRKYLNVSFRDCWFEYEGEYDYTTKTLLPISTLYLSSGVDAVDSNTITFDGCSFSEKFSCCAKLYGCGTVNMYNMSVSGERLIRVDTAHGLLKCTFGNVYVNGADCFLITTIVTGTCEFYGEIVCKPGSAKMYGSNNQFYRITGDCRVVQKITEPLTRTLLNSIQRTPNNYFTMWRVHVFEYIGDNKELYPAEWEWISNNASSVPNSQFDNARRFKSIGSGLGDTASRPVCILSPGFQYYDTDLAKTIVWDGTTWTNLDGTALT